MEKDKSPEQNILTQKNSFKSLSELKLLKKSSTLEDVMSKRNRLSFSASQESESTPISMKRSILKNNSKKLEKEGAQLKSFLFDQIQRKKNLESEKKIGAKNSNKKVVRYSSSINLPKNKLFGLAKEGVKKELELSPEIPKKKDSVALISSIVDRVYSTSPINSEEVDKSFLKKKSILKGLSPAHIINSSKSNSKNVKFDPLSSILDNYSTDKTETLLKSAKTKAILSKERELRNFKNVYDSFSEDEEEKEYIDDTNNFYIHPNKRFKILWDTLCSVFILYSMILTPYRLAFESDQDHKDSFYYIELFIEGVFFIDLILSFFTAYNRYDILVTNSSKIIYNYLTSYFLFDLLSSMPLGFIFFILEQLQITGNYKNLKSFTNIMRFYRLVKWVRILRLLKISKTENSKVWKAFNQILNNVFIKFLLSFLLMIYLTSCLWCFIGKSQIEMNTFSNWIQFNKLDETNNIEVFIAAIYFICSSIFTIGYGDIVASNIGERLFVSLLMIVGSLIWSFVLTSLSHYFSMKDEKKAAFEGKVKIFDEINRDHNLPKKLFDRVRKFLSFEFVKYNRDQVSLVETLPTNLKNNLLVNMYQRHISHLNFFKEQSYDFIIYVLPMLRCVRYLKNEYIINIGSHVEGVYMLYVGSLAVHLGNMYENYEIARVTSSYHIGDILMYANEYSPYDVRVRSRRAEMLILNKQDFASLKLLFKDNVNKILQSSNELYEEIEMKKIAAIEYHKIYGTMKDFRLHIKNPNIGIDDSFLQINNLSEDDSYLTEVKEVNESEFFVQDSSQDDSSDIYNTKLSKCNSPVKSPMLSPVRTRRSNQNVTNNYYSNVFNIQNEPPKQNLIIIKSLNINLEGEEFKVEEENKERELKHPKRKCQSDSSIISTIKSNSSEKVKFKDKKLTTFIINKDKRVSNFRKRNESFLNKINDKIVNEAILMKNNEIMGEYLKEVLNNEKFEEVKLKNLFGKLDKIENKLKNVKKMQLKRMASIGRRKNIFN